MEKIERDIQTQFVKNILTGVTARPKECGLAFASANIALSKYWGKRDASLNLPLNSSLSISLGRFGTRTEIRAASENAVFLNGKKMECNDRFAVRALEFLQLFIPVLGGTKFEIRTQNNIPTAAGLASSASGFAALTLALDDLAGWRLKKKTISMLARIGSGSASRSIFEGFVQWYAGSDETGMDSFSEKLDIYWPEFRIGILQLSGARKSISSRNAMNHTAATSALYKNWPKRAESDFKTIRRAIKGNDFPVLGQAAEKNAFFMHATMESARPPITYLLPQTFRQIRKIQRIRADGLQIYITIDAGPNIKLLFLEKDQASVSAVFPSLQIVRPFD